MAAFIKMHGLGNDFVIMGSADVTSHFQRLNHLSVQAPQKKPSPAQMRLIAHRHQGIGCDQFIWLDTPQNPKAQIHMSIFNPDGSEAEACGNATRCVAWLLTETAPYDCQIETAAGLLEATVHDEEAVTVTMGPITAQPLAEIKTIQNSLALTFTQKGESFFVSVGNPHLVLFPHNLPPHTQEEIGHQLSQHPVFPAGVNVSFADIIDQDHLFLRVFERGTGFTLACGSGACAAAVAAMRQGLTGPKTKVTQPGGTLVIERPSQNSSHVRMSGPVSSVFQGIAEPSLLLKSTAP
ncbi:diaminopimelate epimerase [Alphaproteobacteria bacterium]|nr:diaminopimelate epimerase [Alphaproteobacteria bacterium]